MPAPAIFLFLDATRESPVRAILRRMPPLTGVPIFIERARGLRDRRREAYAGSFLRQRRMVFDCSPRDFPRIFVHELFHFVWLRAGNPARLAYEALLRCEHGAGAHGELGWSAEWRKQALAAGDVRSRTPRWREYCCESFCDTAAWLYSGVRRHPEFTLAGRFRARRRAWFRKTIGGRRLPL